MPLQVEDQMLVRQCCMGILWSISDTYLSHRVLYFSHCLILPNHRLGANPLSHLHD
jgi:hypothetical protein